jgi:hypothetical protein
VREDRVTGQGAGLAVFGQEETLTQEDNQNGREPAEEESPHKTEDDFLVDQILRPVLPGRNAHQVPVVWGG